MGLYAGVLSAQDSNAEPPPAAVCSEALQARRADAAEPRALDQTAGRVIREACTLIFRTPDGTRALTSNLSEDGAHLGYVYRGVLPHEFDLVEVRHYERREYLIIDRSGRHERYLAGEPLVSPDRRRVVAMSLDLVAGIRPNVLEIWRLDEPFAPRLEFAVRSDDWGPSDAVWVDSGTIAFTQSFEPFGERKETARLRLTTSGWSFEPGVASAPAGAR